MRHAAIVVLALPAMAVAAEVQVTWSGRLLDSAGTPLQGNVPAEVRLYTVPTGGTPVYGEPLTLDAQDGYVTAVLGASGGLDSGLFQTGPLYVAVAVGTPLSELSPRGVLTHAPFAAASASVQVGTGGACDAGHVGTFDWDGTNLTLCTTNGALLFETRRQGDGSSAATATESCEILHTDFPSLTSGNYWLDPGGAGPFLAYCDMATYGGGWTLVVKANNGDTVNFYNNHTILSGTNTLNPTTENDATRGDYIGEGFSRIAGDEMLLRDCVGPNDLAGTLSDLIAAAKANPLDPTRQCGLLASGLQMSGTRVGEGTITHLGLACEDDSDTTWVATDDATVISWRDSAGDATTNTAHTVGIAKVGNDGGDDVQNRENAAVDACVMVFWR